MNEMKMGAIESRFADIIWNHEPISTAELSAICQRELKWKRTTTYTVLKRLGERGLFQNKSGTVTSLISRDEYYATKSQHFVDESFGGSLPAFLAVFTARKGLTVDELSELRRIIDSYGEV